MKPGSVSSTRNAKLSNIPAPVLQNGISRMHHLSLVSEHGLLKLVRIILIHAYREVGTCPIVSEVRLFEKRWSARLLEFQ